MLVTSSDVMCVYNFFVYISAFYQHEDTVVKYQLNFNQLNFSIRLVLYINKVVSVKNIWYRKYFGLGHHLRDMYFRHSHPEHYNWYR